MDEMGRFRFKFDRMACSVWEIWANLVWLNPTMLSAKDDIFCIFLTSA